MHFGLVAICLAFCLSRCPARREKGGESESFPSPFLARSLPPCRPGSRLAASSADSLQPSRAGAGGRRRRTGSGKVAFSSRNTVKEDRQRRERAALGARPRGRRTCIAQRLDRDMLQEPRRGGESLREEDKARSALGPRRPRLGCCTVLVSLVRPHTDVLTVASAFPRRGRSRTRVSKYRYG